MTGMVYVINDNRAISHLQINAQNALLCIEARLRFDAGLYYLENMANWTAQTNFCSFFSAQDIVSYVIRCFESIRQHCALLFTGLQFIALIDQFSVQLSFRGWMKVFLTFCTVSIASCNINNNNFVYYLCITYELLLRSSSHMTLENQYQSNYSYQLQQE